MTRSTSHILRRVQRKCSPLAAHVVGAVSILIREAGRRGAHGTYPASVDKALAASAEDDVEGERAARSPRPRPLPWGEVRGTCGFMRSGGLARQCDPLAGGPRVTARIARELHIGRLGRGHRGRIPRMLEVRPGILNPDRDRVSLVVRSGDLPAVTGLS